MTKSHNYNNTAKDAVLFMQWGCAYGQRHCLRPWWSGLPCSWKGVCIYWHFVYTFCISVTPWNFVYTGHYELLSYTYILHGSHCWWWWSVWQTKAQTTLVSICCGCSGAGSGMAGRAAAIPIWNLVWRRHTNLRCRYFARFNTDKLVTPLLLSFYFFTNYFTNRHLNSAYLPTYWLRPTYLLLHRHWWKAWLSDRLGAGGFPLVRVHQ